MNRLAFLSFTCQLRQEGECGSLVNATTPDTHDTRRLATHGVCEVERLAAILREAA